MQHLFPASMTNKEIFFRIHPSVIWAQRKNCVFLTICLDDCQEPEIKVEAAGIYFKGKGGSDKVEHEAKIDLFGNIDPTKSLHVIRPRNIEFCLKKEEDSFWPRLTKSQAKLAWLKIDFNKWKDEDDSDNEGGEGGGPPGPGGPGGDGGGDFEEVIL
jgi:prostaglandin-E synthase